MTKVSAEHLSRGAYVYVRQSTADQLLHNHEESASPVWSGVAGATSRLE